jgi:hypothetical protein
MEIPNPVLEPANVFDPFNEFDSYSAVYITQDLGDWLNGRPEQAAVPAQEESFGDSPAAMSRLDIDVEDAASAEIAESSSGTGQTGSIQPTELAASNCMLFADVETHSPGEFDSYGFEKQIATGGSNPDSCLKGN